MLGLGANKGLHGVGLFIAAPVCVIAKTPIRHLADFKGKKIRIFASQFQTVALERLGATPVAMTLGDVLPALQQGTIDGAIAGIGRLRPFALSATRRNTSPRPTSRRSSMVVEVSKKWYDTLPKDLQKIVDRDGADGCRGDRARRR